MVMVMVVIMMMTMIRQHVDGDPPACGCDR